MSATRRRTRGGCSPRFGGASSPITMTRSRPRSSCNAISTRARAARVNHPRSSTSHEQSTILDLEVRRLRCNPGVARLRGRDMDAAHSRASASRMPNAMTGLDRWLIGTYLDLLRSNDLSRPVSDDPTPQTFVVAPGESVAEIGRKLQAQGLIDDPDLFRLYVRFKGLDATINAGVFTLRPNMNIEQNRVRPPTQHCPRSSSHHSRRPAARRDRPASGATARLERR
ncbi:MAG: hypothetical protein KatS3mg052_0633 [Candidatus Roseilinea sp.]|nr:MAG: hypothetical protein KatS3mg052_0633 [Candidatus Roseilinea sp.]